MAVPMESDLIFYLTHLYMVPTVLLYFFLFYVLHFSREKVNFSSEFYKICAIQDVAVLIQIVDFYITRKLPMSPSASPVLRYLPESGLFPVLLQFSIYYTASVMSLGNAVGSLNRASTIFLGARHQFLWTKSMKFIYLFLFIVPLTFTWNLLFNIVNISFNSVQTSNAIMWHIETPQWASWISSGQCILFCAIISDAWSFFWSMYTLSVIVKRNYFVTNAKSKINSKRLQMFGFSLYLFGLRTTVTLLAVVSKYVKFTIVIEIMFYFLIDIVQFSVPWMFFATQKNVRRSVMNILQRKYTITVYPSDSRVFTTVNNGKLTTLS